MAPCLALLWLVLPFLHFCHLINAQEEDSLPRIQMVRELTDNLLKNYSKHILPSEKFPFNVTVWVQFHTLGEINESEEMFSYVFWLSYMWKDESIKWDRNNTNITWITLSWNDVWTPIFRLVNPHAEVSKSQNVDRSYDTVIYGSDGMAYFDELMTTRTTCDLDMTYYPFDIQTCEVHMFVVGRLKFSFNIDIELEDYLENHGQDHGSWTLINQTASSVYGSFKIKLMFQRKSLFLLVNILLPILLLALLTPMVFILPKKSGERVSYSIALLLAISVYMIIVSDHLPQNSNPMPLVSIMIFICYVLDALIVFVVIINTKLYAMKPQGNLPTICKKFVLLTKKLLTILTCGGFHNHDNNILEEQCKDFGSETLMEIEKENENNENDCKEFHETVAITWEDLSHAIDKWCFIICYFCKIMLPVIFFSICKAKSKKELIDEE